MLQPFQSQTGGICERQAGRHAHCGGREGGVNEPKIGDDGLATLTRMQKLAGRQAGRPARARGGLRGRRWQGQIRGGRREPGKTLLHSIMVADEMSKREGARCQTGVELRIGRHQTRSVGASHDDNSDDGSSEEKEGRKEWRKEGSNEGEGGEGGES